MQSVTFGDCLLSLSSISVRVFQVVAFINSSFLFRVSSFPCGRTTWFVCSPSEGHTSCFQLLATVDQAAGLVGVGSALTKHHRPSGLRTTEIYLSLKFTSQFWGLEV